MFTIAYVKHMNDTYDKHMCSFYILNMCLTYVDIFPLNYYKTEYFEAFASVFSFQM